MPNDIVPGEVPVTTGLETDFYVEVSGAGVTDGMNILSDPQSVTPGMGGHAVS